jgi:predicted DNA-binding transcriptional regulator AlpA
MNQLPETGFMRLPQIIGSAKRGIPPLIPVSKSTWWSRVKEGKYPAGIKMGYKLTVWRVEDVRALIEKLGGARP